MQKAISLALLLLFCLGIGKGLHHVRHGFNPRRIQNESKTSLHLNEETKQILSQPFRYLGRGRQCFAFVSEDDRYVLKLLRTDIYYPSFWMRAFPCSFSQKIQKNRFNRFEFVTNSFILAVNKLKKQTGSIALHLGTLKQPHLSFISDHTHKASPEITLIDSIGCTYHLPLETTSFALQYKHPIWAQEFLKAVQNKDSQTASKLLEALLDNVVERGKKGILNRDRSFLRNYGFDGESAYQIDLGSFFVNDQFDPSTTFHKSVCDSIDPVQEWLSQVAPDLLNDFNQKLHSKLLMN